MDWQLIVVAGFSTITGLYAATFVQDIIAKRNFLIMRTMAQEAKDVAHKAVQHLEDHKLHSQKTEEEWNHIEKLYVDAIHGLVTCTSSPQRWKKAASHIMVKRSMARKLDERRETKVV